MPLAQNDNGFVLHTRPYRETSQLVDLFCREHGRFRVIANGTRGARKGPSKRLQSFVPCAVHWRGRGELKTLVSAEPVMASQYWGGDTLYIGLYINELMTRLVPEHDPHPELFDSYVQLLQSLPGTTDIEPLLRIFELTLLEQLGYGIALDVEVISGAEMDAECWYRFVPEDGFSLLGTSAAGMVNAFKGADLKAMASSNYENPDVKRAAKRLLRLALDVHLGGRPLRSREFFRGVSNQGGGAG